MTDDPRLLFTAPDRRQNGLSRRPNSNKKSKTCLPMTITTAVRTSLTLRMDKIAWFAHAKVFFLDAAEFASPTCQTLTGQP